MTEIAERRAVISGAGQSDVGRRLHRHPLYLTVDACLAAIADAGLDRRDVDGIATYPGSMDTPPGFSGAGVVEVQDALRLDLNWYAGGLEAPGQLGSVVNACLAVAGGLANHVLCFRTVFEGSAQGDKGENTNHPDTLMFACVSMRTSTSGISHDSIIPGCLRSRRRSGAIICLRI